MLRFLLSLRRGNTSDWWRKKEETSSDLACHQGPSWLVRYFQRPPTLPLAPAFLLLQCKRKEKHVNMMEAVGLCDHCALLTLRLGLSRFHFSHVGHTCLYALCTSWLKYCWYCAKRFLLRLLVKGQDLLAWKRQTLPDSCIIRTEVQVVSRLNDRPIQPQTWCFLN